MIITTWNIRGLNSKGKQRYLKEILRKDKPSVMLLQETKISELKLKEIMGNIKPRYEIVGQDVIGSAGGVYSPHIPGERRTFIRNLVKERDLHKDTPWIIGVDFNMITSLNEKRGGVRRIDGDMELFADTINDQRLVDILTNNGIHKWNNRRGEKHQIASRLDIFLISEQIMSRDILVEAMILPGLGSDHWLVKLEIDLKASPKN
eukprot:PITA_35223